MTTPRLTAILTLAAALAAAPALASPERGAMRGGALQDLSFAEIDANGDGAITLEEWRGFLTSRAETVRAERIGARVVALMQGDADGDNLLSAEELGARLEALRDERRAAWQEGRGPRGDDVRARRGEGERGWRRGEHGQHHAMGRAMGYGMDRSMDQDGAIDRDDRIVRSFQRIDRDGDARVTEVEFDLMVERMQQRMDRRAERMERGTRD